jgi:hypothetical protein
MSISAYVSILAQVLPHEGSVEQDCTLTLLTQVQLLDGHVREQRTLLVDCLDIEILLKCILAQVVHFELLAGLEGVVETDDIRSVFALTVEVVERQVGDESVGDLVLRLPVPSLFPNFLVYSWLTSRLVSSCPLIWVGLPFTPFELRFCLLH